MTPMALLLGLFLIQAFLATWAYTGSSSASLLHKAIQGLSEKDRFCTAKPLPARENKFLVTSYVRC